MGNRRSRRKFNPASTRHWHRYLGIFAALFVILLCGTGIMLNHTEELALDSSYVRSNLLLDIYGIGLPSEPISFSAKDSWVSQIGRKVYLNGKFICDSDGATLIGVVLFQNLFVISFENQLLLIDDEGEIFEKLGSESGVPTRISKVGLNDKGNVVVLAAQKIFATDEEFISWQPTESAPIAWSTSGKLPNSFYQKMEESYRGKGLPLERIILDLHSGRIFGPWGVYLFDGIAVILMVLSFSGIYIYFFPAGMRRKKQSLNSEV